MTLEQRRQRARRLNSDDSPEPVEKGDGGDEVDPDDLELDYSGILKSDEEKEREKDAAAIGEAVADELAVRGLGGDDDGDAAPSADDGGSVEKSGETTADLLDDVRDDLRGMKRAEEFRTLLKNYVADGGDPDDRLPEVLSWYNRQSEATVKVEDGSVTVENAAT